MKFGLLNAQSFGSKAINIATVKAEGAKGVMMSFFLRRPDILSVKTSTFSGAVHPATSASTYHNRIQALVQRQTMAALQHDQQVSK